MIGGVRLPAIGGPEEVVGFGEKKSSESGEGVDFALTKYHDY